MTKKELIEALERKKDIPDDYNVIALADGIRDGFIIPILDIGFQKPTDEALTGSKDYDKTKD